MRRQSAWNSSFCMLWSGLLKLFFFLGAALARAVTGGAKAAREKEERQRRQRANERSALLSLPEDVLGFIFACLEPCSRRALLCTACSVRQVPQVLEQLAPTVKLRDLARDSAVGLGHLLPSHFRSIALRRLSLAGELLKGGITSKRLIPVGPFDTDVTRLVRLLRQLRSGTLLWHELQGLGELQVKYVWEASDEDRIKEGGGKGLPCCQLPSLHTLRLQHSYCPTFVRALAETQTGQQLRTLVLDLSYPHELDTDFDALSSKERSLFQRPGPLAEYMPVLTKLESLQVLHIRCQPIMLLGVSLAKLRELKNLKHLTLCIPSLSASSVGEDSPGVLELREDNKLQLSPLKLDLLEVETLEIYIFDCFRSKGASPVERPFRPKVPATLQKFVCDSLRLTDLAALYAGLPELQVIQVGSLGIECTTQQEAAMMATRIRSSPRFGQVQLVLGNCSPDDHRSESASATCDDNALFTLLCSTAPLRDHTTPHPLSLMHLALSSLIGTPSFTRVTTLCLKHVDLAEEEEFYSLADLFPSLTQLSLISPTTGVQVLDTSRYLGWYIAVLRLPRLELLESDHFCSLSPNHERMIEEIKCLNEAVLATCASAQRQGRHFTLVPGHMYPSFARQIQNFWGQQFGRVEHQGISCKLVLCEDFCLGVRARLVFQCEPLCMPC